MSYSNRVYLHGYCNLFIHYFNIISTHSLQLSIAPTTQIHRKNPYEKSDRNPHEKPTRKPVGSAPICHWSASAPRGCCRSAAARLLPICHCQVAADLPLPGCCRSATMRLLPTAADLGLRFEWGREFWEN